MAEAKERRLRVERKQCVVHDGPPLTWLLDGEKRMPHVSKVVTRMDV